MGGDFAFGMSIGSWDLATKQETGQQTISVL